MQYSQDGHCRLQRTSQRRCLHESRTRRHEFATSAPRPAESGGLHWRTCVRPRNTRPVERAAYRRESATTHCITAHRRIFLPHEKLHLLGHLCKQTNKQTYGLLKRHRHRLCRAMPLAELRPRQRQRPSITTSASRRGSPLPYLHRMHGAGTRARGAGRGGAGRGNQNVG
jgi:hypothetical protein